MEFRSSRRQNENEYKELITALNDMGLYEEGMELYEMRQIIDALQQSESELESNILGMDLERALRESEMDIVPFNNEIVFSSTMDMGSSPCTSPEIPAQLIVVHADVHHPQDWSPGCSEEGRLQRKRLATSPPKTEFNPLINSIHNANEIVQPNAKRVQNCMEVKTCTQESLSIIDLNNNSINVCQDDSTSTQPSIDENHFSHHKVVGPISMRPPPNDSGLNSGNRTAETSTTPSSSSLSSTSATSSSVKNSTQNSFDSCIEVVGPVSLRRPIHDSGVTSFNETANISSSSWDVHISTRDSIEHINSNQSLNLLPNISHHASDKEKSNTTSHSLLPAANSDEDNCKNSESSF